MKMLFSAVALASLGFTAAGQGTATGNATNGKQLFEKENCYYCHGTAGQGGRDGARIAATNLSAQQFIRYVRRPAGSMPAFTEKILTDSQLMDIYAYVKALPSAKDPKQIPLLNQSREK